MLIVARELIHAVKILFTTTKYRLILVGIVLLAAMISVSELAVAKLFTKIISHEKTLSHTKMIILVIVFFIFFGINFNGSGFHLM